MLRSVAAPLPFLGEGASHLIYSLMNAVYQARARRAREEIARHAALIESARRHRLALDGRTWEQSHG